MSLIFFFKIEVLVFIHLKQLYLLRVILHVLYDLLNQIELDYTICKDNLILNNFFIIFVFVLFVIFLESN